MFKSRTYTWSLTCLFGSLTWFAPGQADACWWWQRRSTYYVAPVVANYAPVVASTPVVANYAPAAACCQQVCQYVPQTAYRAQAVSVPVTSLMPVTGVDACTGCPVTTFRPVTSFVQQTQMVPYTTYRQVCSSVCPTTVCSVAAPVATVAAVPAPCATCAPAAVATGVPGASAADITPTLPQGAIQPQTFQAAPGAANGGAGGAPQSTSRPETRIEPVPDHNLQNGGTTNGGTATGGSTNSAIAPRWSDPRNRTALSPAGQPRSFSAVSRVVDQRGLPQTPAPTAPAVDFGGWRASKR